ncbi:hypothetical protein EYF80_063758 [Liparis tanakae]|uniref:Uncharacterized protein n=1 Tax=Liparis tanakae TaxID=230148 RepID=A0A4Z2EB90_9TELE|nr:hypothetical protein EYF80_063758 [Liparis tanakae]
MNAMCVQAIRSFRRSYLAVKGHDPRVKGHNPRVKGHDPRVKGHNPRVKGHNPRVKTPLPVYDLWAPRGNRRQDERHADYKHRAT